MDTNTSAGGCLVAERVLGACCVVLALAAFVLLRSSSGIGDLLAIPSIQSPQFFPSAVACVLGLSGLALLLGPRGAKAQSEGTDGSADPPGGEATTSTAGVAIVAASLGIYGAGLFLVGFLVASMLAILTLGLALGYRRLSILIPLAICFPFAVLLVFQKSARIMLPEGLLF
ncbi:tripartite tricarboxylate transporter TctB family protein [Elioraea rosea]|uniref:tripartite tricarboxylate transporter TctB family protein n=1 Tax=Elioraea rosea TaxID=2492390 RepID=UPI001183FDD0|nr:tripartite tricarboxylate transporter TctB family protein [Elioraea rosea]